MIWLLGGYMWLFIHRPFEVWPALGGLHIERVYMIGTILYWAVAVDKHWIRNRLNAAFAFFWVAVLVSWAVSSYSAQASSTVENYFKLTVFYVLVMSSIRSERNMGLLVMIFLGAMALYMAHSLWEYHCGRGMYRMGVWRMVGVDKTHGDPNSFAATIVYSLPMVLPAWRLACTNRQRGLLMGYAGLAVVCILLTGSRSALCSLVLLLGIAAFFSRHRVTLLAALGVAAPIVWFSLRADLQNRFLTLIDPSYGPANAQVSAESRWQGWYDGVRIWKEHRLLGAGPGSFMAARGCQLQAHNLYGQVLGELGTLGALALAAVVCGFIGNTMILRRLCQHEPELTRSFSATVVLAVTVTVILLLFDGLSGHNLYRYTWLWFGAFQAIALNCIRQHAGKLAGESEPYLTTAEDNNCWQDADELGSNSLNTRG
jgi:O-antigen ligase